MTRRRGLLYHFTHISNLASIAAEGLYSDAQIETSRRTPTEVGHADVKRRRRNLAVPLAPGGCVADYVPFYFAARSPMLFIISKGDVPTYSGSQDESEGPRHSPTRVVLLMAEFIDAHGNLLKAEVEAFANSVNTVGVMGKGIALQFKNAFPANFKAYEAACKMQAVELGKMFVFDNGRLTTPHWIINFPTKGHWRARSRIRDVADGLDDLRHVIEELEISSVALPPLGCGHGGLDWDEVRALIEERLGDLDVVVHLYAPEGAPDAADMVISTPRSKLTTSTAALVSVIDQYSQVALFVTLIEIHKLMYFLQEAGEDLKLDYQAKIYGPYADNLRHVLKSLEGHQLEGFGDGSKKVREAELITVRPDGVREASEALAGNQQIAERIERVLELVEGYESAYGLELLASVHWMAAHGGTVNDLDGVTKRVQSWSQRKRRMFTAQHIESAWHRLHNHGWLAVSSREVVGA